jgi:hypothetical protein
MGRWRNKDLLLVRNAQAGAMLRKGAEYSTPAVLLFSGKKAAFATLERDFVCVMF